MAVHRDCGSLNGLFSGGVNHRTRRRGRNIRGYLDAAAERHKKRERQRVGPFAHVRLNGEVEGPLLDPTQLAYVTGAYRTMPERRCGIRANTGSATGP